MRIVPVRNSVICEKIEGEHVVRGGPLEKGFEIEDEDRDFEPIVEIRRLPIYRVLAFSPGDGFEFSEGDLVAVQGKGDEVEISPGKSIFRFNVENIMCKISP